MANLTIVANFNLDANAMDFAQCVALLTAAKIQYEVLNPTAAPVAAAPQPKAEEVKAQPKAETKKATARKSTQTTKWSDEFPKSVYLAYGKKLKVLTSDGKKVKSDSREMVYKTMVADGYDWWCDSKHTTKASQRYC